MSAEAYVRAYGAPPLDAVLRAQPEDFRVTEELGYGADGEGEHVLLRVRKRGLTTAQAADALARHAGVRALAVGWAGMKDRHAITEQSFSVQLAGCPEPDWTALGRDDLTVLEHARHRRKLKRGALEGNRFVLVLRAVSGERERADAMLQRIGAEGVPNRFGAQRFGRRGDNVEQARAMFAGRRVPRHQRSILLSAARSQLFNQVLDARVRDGSWNRALDGELFALAGSRSWFGPEAPNAALAQRLRAGDIHPSGPLWGAGVSPAAGAVATLENAIAGLHPELCAGLAAAGLRQERRALRLLPSDLEWAWPAPDALELRFALPAGGYATTVVDAVATVRDAWR